ncbi:MAG TPA: tetratricopeptide repeat protein, partial [Bacteroidetes bacterium]|nr:tetratricopeptide repeat protein [Bacteroidota bacterium]
MSRILLILLSILVSFSSFSQSEKKDGRRVIIPREYSDIHHEGERALLMKRYHEAIRLFKRVLKKYPDFPPALRSMGACYEMTGDYEKATRYYEAALESNPYFSRALYFEIANIHYKCGRYDLALQSFERFDSLLHEDPKQFTYNGFEEQKVEEKYYALLDASRRACRIALDSIRFWNITGVENLGSAINTKADEYFPFLTNDGQTLFYTSRKDEQSDENLFVSQYNGNGWDNGSKVPGFNTRQNEGMTTLVRDGQHLFFTACERESVLGTCDIWRARVDGGEVFDARPLPGMLNSDAWESQASISCDGSVLYFASNRPGGHGGTDIWKCTRLPNGDWSQPVNLGSHINTPGDEEAPFITNDAKTLYFSSTGHIGLGEQDIFMSRLSGENFWSLPVNLGMPVNSSYRELGFFLSADGRTGYFASDRAGGQGGMDIYRFDLPDPLQSTPITYVQGTVIDSITGLPVVATVVVKDRQTFLTDDDGRFFLCVQAGHTLDIKILHKDYHPYRRLFGVPEWDNATFFPLNIALDPLFKLPDYNELIGAKPSMVSLKYSIGKQLKHNVLFDFDEAKLKVESIKELERFLREVFEE